MTALLAHTEPDVYVVCLVIEMHELTRSGYRNTKFIDARNPVPILIEIYHIKLPILADHHTDKGKRMNIIHPGFPGTSDQYTPQICAV